MVLDIKHLRVPRDGRPIWPDTPDLMKKALQQLDAEIYDLVTAIYSASIDRHVRCSIHMVTHPLGGPSADILIARAVDLFNTISMSMQTMGIPPRAVIRPSFNIHPIERGRDPVTGLFGSGADSYKLLAESLCNVVFLLDILMPPGIPLQAVEVLNGMQRNLVG